MYSIIITRMLFHYVTGGRKGKEDGMDRQDFFAFCLQKPEFRDLALKYINDNETSEDIKNNMSEGIYF